MATAEVRLRLLDAVNEPQNHEDLSTSNEEKETKLGNMIEFFIVAGS